MNQPDPQLDREIAEACGYEADRMGLAVIAKDDAGRWDIWSPSSDANAAAAAARKYFVAHTVTTQKTGCGCEGTDASGGFHYGYADDSECLAICAAIKAAEAAKETSDE